VAIHRIRLDIISQLTSDLMNSIHCLWTAFAVGRQYHVTSCYRWQQCLWSRWCDGRH